MNYQIEDFDIYDKLDELELVLPEKLTFFPENFKTTNSQNEFVFTDSVTDLNKLFKQNNVEIQSLGGEADLFRSRKSADIYLPVLFYSLTLITENPTIISVSLNVLSNYITDFFKGSFGKKTATIELIIETKEKGKLKKINYKGDAQGLKELEGIIKSMQK